MGGFGGLLGILASSYTTNIWAFIALFGGLSGLGSGITYPVVFVLCWEYFPERKGLLTGISSGAFGFGSFFYTILANKLTNPDDAKATIHIDDVTSYFEPEIANNVPGMLRVLVVIWTVQISVAILLVSRNKDAKKIEDTVAASESLITDALRYDKETGEAFFDHDLTSVKAATKSLRFW